MRRAIAFAAAMLALIAATAWGAMALFPGEGARQAILTSAGVAFSVQLLTFGVARALLPVHLMAGWGAGMLVRLITLMLHGFVGVPMLGLPLDASLLSLAAFFFLTSLIEPLFLERSAPVLRPTP